MKADQFDLMQINNDFSSFDVLESLSVTFSSSRPLISVGDDLNRYQSLLAKARQPQCPESKHTILKTIGLDLLENVAMIRDHCIKRV